MSSYKCNLCNSDGLTVFHKGVRDNKDIDVLKCPKCGLLQLSKFVTFEDFYQNGGMHNEMYHSCTDKVGYETWDLWVQETQFDDVRRENKLMEICKGKRVLDFGCGNGGFLKRIQKYTTEVVGVELDETAREHLKNETFPVYDSKEKLGACLFDVIIMFQVIEHLTTPKQIITNLMEHLDKGGIMIIETPNANDALISLYKNDAFQDFTFWTEHVMLYNSENLKQLMEECGFEEVEGGYVQRYPLSNHLYWLSNNAPGGHEKWKFINDENLDSEYEKMLKKNGMCDTLFSTFRLKK